MKKNKQMYGTPGRRFILFVLLLSSVMLSGNFVFAQEVDEEGEFVLEEIVVTGSRIRTSGMETPTPVTVVSVQEIDVLSPVALVDGLAELPQFYGSNTTQTLVSFFAGSGSGNLNLRGLNDKRTLQLLDSRRVVPSTIFGGPDINLFPEYLLRSIETVTGGASAAYGTDAVAGVVNFILDTEYEGIKGKYQYGVTEKGHGETREMSIAGGFDLKNGAHLLLSAERRQQDPIWGNDIYDYDWYDARTLLANPDTENRGTTPDNPYYLPAQRVRSMEISEDGIFNFGGALGRYILDADGNASPFVMGDFCNGAGCSTVNGGSGEDLIHLNTAGQLSPRNNRDNFFGFLDYDVNANLRVYVQALYGETEAWNKNFGGLFPSNRAFTIYRENPFLPDDIAQIMDDNNLTSVKFGRIGSLEDIGFNAFQVMTTTTHSYTGGAEYNVTKGIFDGWQVKSYYQYGETEVEYEQRGGIRLDRIYLAADVVTDPVSGLPACNVTVTSGLYPDCVPLNLFGRGNASAEAVGWVTGFETGVEMNAHGLLDEDHYVNHTYLSRADKSRTVNIEQQVFEISADGDIFEGWGAGPVKMGLGYNYRTESFTQVVEVGPGGNVNADGDYRPVMANNAALGIRGVPGGAAASGNMVEIQFSAVPFARGSQDVHEAFGEVLVPLLTDLPFVKQLNFSGAYRWAKYSGSGDTESWKTGLDWSVYNDLRLRGTVSRDVRAATIGEKFDRTGGLAFITDYAVDPAGSFGSGAMYWATSRSNGSPDIQPEKAKTYTAGLVYMPKWLPGLSIAADWYKIKVDDNINQLGGGDVVKGCTQDNDPVLCAFLTRDGEDITTVNGETIKKISLVRTPYYNQESVEANGVDFEIAYTRNVEWLGGGERVSLRFLGSYMGERSNTNVMGETTEFAGTFGFPEWTANLTGSYYRGSLGLTMTARYTDDTILNRNWNHLGDSTRWDVFDNTVDEEILVDARANYRFELGKMNLNLFVNVNNLFDKAPEQYLSGEFASSFNNDTGPGVTGDLRGRRFVFGVDFEF